MLKRLYIYLTIGTVLCFNYSCFQEHNDQVYRNLSDTVGYVGVETCKACHYDKWETYSHTGMGQSFGMATKSKSASNIHKDSILHDSYRDFYYQPHWDSDTLKLLEYRLQHNDTTHKRIQNIDYIIGSGHHTNSHLINTNGYVNQVPFTYYTQEERFDLPPGYEGGYNTRFDRKIGLECMSCHNSLPDMIMGSQNKYKTVHMGISCERCHGPGELHVKEKIEGKIVDTSKFIDYSIVNPSDLTAELQFDLCSRCHLQGNAVLHDDKSFFDFKPGMHLEEVMDIYLPKYSNDDEFIMASHVDRLKMSQCFIKSNGDLTCLTCHNPHLSIRQTPDDVFNKACIDCHGETIQHKTQITSDCVSCHMPPSGSKDIPHVTVSDHNIAIHTEAKQYETDIEKIFKGLYAINNDNPSVKSKLNSYLQQFEKFEQEDYYLDSAYLYLNSLNIEDCYNEWIQYYFFRLDYEGLVSWFESISFKSFDTQISIKSYDNKHAWTWYRIAESYYMLGDITNSVKYYTKAARLAPYHLDIQNKFAVALMKAGKLQSAKEIFEFIISENPIFEKVYPSYGYLLTIMGFQELGAKQYEKAIKLNPDLLYAWLNYAAYFYNRGDIDSVKTCLNEVLRIEPEHMKAKQLLSDINEKVIN